MFFNEKPWGGCSTHVDFKTSLNVTKGTFQCQESSFLYTVNMFATLNAGTPNQTHAAYRLDTLTGFSRAREKLRQSES